MGLSIKNLIRYLSLFFGVSDTTLMSRQEAELTSLRDWATVLIRFAFAAEAEFYIGLVNYKTF